MHATPSLIKSSHLKYEENSELDRKRKDASSDLQIVDFLLLFSKVFLGRMAILLAC